jgi:hypothetical protein
MLRCLCCCSVSKLYYFHSVKVDYTKAQFLRPFKLATYTCMNFISAIIALNFNTLISLSPHRSLYPPQCLSLTAGRGLQKNNLKNTVTLGELPRQYIPCPSTTLKRQILCLTNEGLHILHRVRPIDRLYRIINGTSTRARLREEYEFLVSYGAVESVCACLGIACGVPYDAGVSGPESTGRWVD